MNEFNFSLKRKTFVLFLLIKTILFYEFIFELFCLKKKVTFQKIAYPTFQMMHFLNGNTCFCIFEKTTFENNLESLLIFVLFLKEKIKYL